MKTHFETAILCCVLFVFRNAIATAQAPAQIERRLLEDVKKVDDSSAYRYRDTDSDRLEKLNSELLTDLLKYTKVAATMDYSFPKLSKEMEIVTSADKRFRIYTWDRQDGGTMHFFETVYQYRGDDGRVYSRGRFVSGAEKEEGPDAAGYVDDIFTLQTKQGKIYLASFSSILSTSERAASVNLFSINGSTLSDQIKLIKTARGLTNTLGFEYDLFSINVERPPKLITYDSATRSISIPVVIVEAKYQYGRVTGKRIIYRYNGAYFVKVA